MYTIIPLAGPDFYQPRYGVKPLTLVDGEPLLLKAFFSRPWNKKEKGGEGVIFVLREDTEAPLQEFRFFIQKFFPRAHTVVITSLTQGALLSSIAASALVTDFSAPIVVDLVDFLYETSLDPKMEFQRDQKLQGILTWFPSSDPAYSYLEIVNNRVLKTVEKKVISNNASVGTYFFRDLPTLFRTTFESVLHHDQVSYKNNLFVAPAFSFMQGNVLPIEVHSVRSLSKDFKL